MCLSVRRGGACAVLALCLSIAMTRPVFAQCSQFEIQKLTASDAAIIEQFGSAASVSGDVMLIGAFNDSDFALGAGSAYVFRWNGSTFTEEQELVASDAAGSDFFGQAVVIRGDVAIVGSWADDSPTADAGSAYVFRHNGTMWVEEQKLKASDAGGSDGFGNAVAVSGNLAVIGAQGEDTSAADNDRGAVYVFRFNGTSWVEEQKLNASDFAKDDRFGFNVAVDGNVILVSAYFDDNDGKPDTGSAYVFRHNGSTFVQEQKLLASDRAVSDFFASSVSLSGNVALIGATGDDDLGDSSGSAYVFRYNGSTWVQEQKLKASDGTTFDVLGSGASVSGNLAVISAHGDDDEGNAAGAAYVFRYTGGSWVQAHKLLASDGDDSDLLGAGVGESVSLSGNVAVVGAYADEAAAGVLSGSAYVFEIPLLALDSNLDSVSAGQTLTLSTCGGLPLAPVILFAASVNGTPTFQPLGFGIFDANGKFIIGGTVPPGLSGLDVGFESFGYYIPGRAGPSNVVPVTFL